MPEAPSAICSFKRRFGAVCTRLLPIPAPEVVSGEGSLAQVGHILARMGCSRALVVTDEMLVKCGCVQRCTEALQAAGLDHELFDAVVPDPKEELVEAGFELYQRRGCDGILAVGGGSPMDCAKIIGAKVANPKDVASYEGLLQVTWYGLAGRLPPLVAVPTTAGSGSEVTVGAVVTLPSERRKITIADPGLVPKAAVLDPEVLSACPRAVLAATGMDALTHAIESFLSSWATTDTRRHSLLATELIFRHLMTTCGLGEAAADAAAVRESRTAMLRASFEAGLAFTRVHCGYVHAISHQLGGMFHTPHGEANAMLLVPVLKFYICGDASDDIAAQMCELSRAAGLSSHYEVYEPEAQRKLAQAFVDKVALMAHDLGLPKDVPAMKSGDVREVATRALGEAHGELRRGLCLEYFTDLGYPVPKYMSMAECEAIVAGLLPSSERSAWERQRRTVPAAASKL